MRIAQIGAIVTPDGSFGGPVRVAINQTRALRALGHEVTLFAGASGFDYIPEQVDGIEVELFPTRQLVPRSGFLGQVSLTMLRHLSARLRHFDVVHIHVGRDLVTLPAAWLAANRGVPYVVQSHGMIGESDHPLAGVLDAGLTRPALRRASSVLYLTDAEREGLTNAIDPHLRLTHLANGVPLPGETRPNADQLEVLYMARIQERKRPVAFVDAAVDVASKVGHATFALVGPDEGMGVELAKRIESVQGQVRIAWEGALSSDKTLERMSKAAIFVLPSINEPFPMAVLEAMSLGIPVIVTETCGLASQIVSARAGLVVDDSHAALVQAIDTLVTDAAMRKEMGENARQLVAHDFSMSAIAQQLAAIYEGAIVP